MSAPKQRVRLYAAGETMYRLIRPDKGWGGPYGQERRPAKWACIHCGAQVSGDDNAPWVVESWGPGEPPAWLGTRWSTKCARNGHAPCQLCGKPLPRLNDGCPRAHGWRQCPAKTEAHRLQAQHAAVGHRARGKV